MRENPRFGISNVPPLATLSAAAAAVLVVVIAVFVVLGQTGVPGGTGATGLPGATGQPRVSGQPGATGLPGASDPPGATSQPGATGLPGASDPPGATSQPGATGQPVGSADAGLHTATLTITGGDFAGTWVLDGLSGDVSPAAEFIAGIWTKAIDNSAAGYGDLITVQVSGPIISGSEATSKERLIVALNVSRFDGAGNDLFAHQFDSHAGECQVTMQRTEEGVSGTFSCGSITDKDGHTVGASGSFAT